MKTIDELQAELKALIKLYEAQGCMLMNQGDEYKKVLTEIYKMGEEPGVLWKAKI